jgi:DNA ligase D-like protein (predicted polymerase)/DNA ligase D-like protein (predicted 3'-phosphoesterase)
MPKAKATGALTEYSAKRSFASTPEPPPRIDALAGGPLLFVVQQHAATRLHYDLRLECDGVLKSWAVPKGPTLVLGEKRLAMQTEDHPYDYASFEGVIPPKQYGAGEVIVWDCGIYSPDEGGATWFHDRAQALRAVNLGLEKGKLSFLLRGEKLKGSFALVRTKEAKQWLLLKHKDRFATTTDVTAQNRSVLSGVAVDYLKMLPVPRVPAAQLVPAGAVVAMPGKLAPMLAESGDAAFNHAEWMWEPKLDGYRVLAFMDERGVRLRSRRGIELGLQFPRLCAELAGQMVSGMILDGELVAFDASGKPSFAALQDRAGLKTQREIDLADQNTPVVLFCFDLPYFAGIDLRQSSYGERRRYLAQCLLPSPLVQLVHAADDGVALQTAALASGFEGVVGKRKDSRYESGRRCASWLKVKPTQSADFVVGGYTSGKGARTGVPSSLPSPAAPGNGTIDDILAQLANPKTTFAIDVGPHRIPLTHLDRAYWPADAARNLPAYTKRDLLRYVAQVSSCMLPHLADRPLTMIRMPQGIRGQRFFQKHWEQERPAFVEAITVFSGHKDERHEYLLCNNLPTLLWLAQSGTLEFHVWHSRAKLGPDAISTSTDYATSLETLEASALNYPDFVLFDIDPYIYSGKEAQGAEPELNTVAFEKGKQVAFWLRELLQSMGLDAIVKTSGKTGLHVFVPIRRTLDFDAVRHVCELVGRHLMRPHPKDITMEWSIPRRTGKIFMDHNMNVRGKTLNVAYSPRGEPGAPVSMPLTWEELAGAHPLDFTIANVPQRLARNGDRWQDALQRKQDLEQTLARVNA